MYRPKLFNLSQEPTEFLETKKTKSDSEKIKIQVLVGCNF